MIWSRIFVSYPVGGLIGFLYPFSGGRYSGNSCELSVHGPGEVFCGWPCIKEFTGCLFKVGAGVFPRSVQRCAIYAVSSSGADKSGTPYMHVPYCSGKIINCFEFLNNKTVGQIPLINDFNDVRIVFLGPDSPVVFAINVHSGRLLYSIFRKKAASRDNSG
jgi:hypothetical protein